MTFLPDVHRSDWLHDLVAAIALVALPGLILFGTSGRLLMFAVVGMVILSFLAGYWLVPRDLWLSFSVAFLLTWASVGIADRVGVMGEGEPYDIAPWFVGVMILVPMIVVAFVPLWTGRLLRRDHVRIAEGRKAAAESH